jgi:succinyl-CoA synthetase beta subunit
VTNLFFFFLSSLSLVPRGGVATTPAEARKIAESLKTEDLIVKAQVLAGGRGKGVFDNGFKGGVHLARNADDVESLASKMLGNRLITKQTGSEGRPVDKVLVAEREFIRHEMYLAVLLDREAGAPVVVGSPRGGMDIEAVAKEDPDAIYKLALPVESLSDPEHAIDRDALRKMAADLGLVGSSQVEQAADTIQSLYKLFVERDCVQCEINPLIETADGRVVCTDAKFNFDPNAEFRQQEIFAHKDPGQADPREVAAAQHDLNFIGLDGNIGCLVNGAGLAMATMDVIQLSGGSPANFLDVGGGATEKQVTEALRILANDPKVEAILVNIFGGIMRCDVIAMGLLNAYTLLNMKIPLVVRLQGTNFLEAKKLLEGSGLRIIGAESLSEAADKAVQVAAIVKMARDAQINVSFELPY